jgi:hypothetical protein
MNIIESLRILKSVRATDEFYLDDSGKHVIFRNINGKVTPIQVTAEEYAEWLLEQGVEIDPADQTQLNQIEDQLDVLERAAEISPELQKQYEEAFNQQRQQYYQHAQQYYQQALENQAQQQGVPSHVLHEKRKQTYEANKESTVPRKNLPDRGWESYLKGYTERIIKENDIKPNSVEWFLIQAFDVLMVRASELARDGASPSKISLKGILEKELEENYPTLKKHLNDRYKEYRPDGREYFFDANIILGLKNLRENMRNNTESFSQLSEMLDSKYSMMYQDFTTGKETFVPMKPMAESTMSRESIPQELPDEYTREESTALYGVFKAFKNSPAAGANRVALHTLARLYDSIPEKDRAMVASELSDGSKGLHAIHKSEFSSVYQRKVTLGMSVDIEQEMEEILRFAAKASNGTTQAKVQAMKEIAARLGRIDGIHAFSLLNEENPSARSFQNKWKDASLNTGRQKGEGPDLIGNIIDDESRQRAMYKNRTLKLYHKPKGPEEKPKKELEVPSEIKKPVAMHGFEKVGDSFISPEGWKLTPDPSGTWPVFSPEGAKVGEVFVQKTSDRESAVKARMKALREARKVIENNLEESEEPTPEIGVFGFKDFIHKDDTPFLTDFTDFVKERGLQVNTVVPGSAFQVSDGAKSITLLRGKDNGRLFMAEKGGRPQQADMVEVLKFFGNAQKSSNFIPGLSFSQPQK